MDINKCRGRFRIPRMVIDDMPRAAMAVMAHVIVVRAELLFHADVIEYDALCGEMRVLGEGEQVPYYAIEVESYSPDCTIVRFVEKGDAIVAPAYWFTAIQSQEPESTEDDAMIDFALPLDETPAGWPPRHGVSDTNT